jgi:hypothetical protein
MESLAIGDFHHIMQITNADATDSSLQSSISVKVVGTPSPFNTIAVYKFSN